MKFTEEKLEKTFIELLGLEDTPQCSHNTITEHIQNIFNEGELDKKVV
jgi:hypothetical protein